ITYRGGSLARDLDDRLGIRAGDRAPDARCTDPATGARVRLFDLFRGTHFTLLVFGTGPAPRVGDDVHVHRLVEHGDGEGALIDSDGEAHALYGVDGDGLVLVRPDGYVALTGAGWDENTVSGYLARAIGARVPERLPS
ncbi:MAG: hypothetical protein IRZ07_25605, partial [Microbispora sp.]|nr:hypothetical protein [Microbispora sp.]